MSLIKTQMEALRRDAKAIENTTWLKWLRRKRKTVNEWDERDYHEREDTREREREYPNRYDEPEERAYADDYYRGYDQWYGP